MQRARRRRRPAASLYLDIVAAFYSMVRELVVGFAGSSAQIGPALARLGIPDDAASEFIPWIHQQGSVLADAGVSEHLQGIVRGWHQVTWLATDSLDTIAITERDAVPGVR